MSDLKAGLNFLNVFSVRKIIKRLTVCSDPLCSRFFLYRVYNENMWGTKEQMCCRVKVHHKKLKTLGIWVNADRNTGLRVISLIYGWYHSIKPQSPVKADTPFSSSRYLIAVFNLLRISSVKVPFWHNSNVKPGTTR